MSLCLKKSSALSTEENLDDQEGSMLCFGYNGLRSLLAVIIIIIGILMLISLELDDDDDHFEIFDMHIRVSLLRKRAVTIASLDCVPSSASSSSLIRRFKDPFL